MIWKKRGINRTQLADKFRIQMKQIWEKISVHGQEKETVATLEKDRKRKKYISQAFHLKKLSHERIIWKRKKYELNGFILRCISVIGEKKDRISGVMNWGYRNRLDSIDNILCQLKRREIQKIGDSKFLTQYFYQGKRFPIQVNILWKKVDINLEILEEKFGRQVNIFWKKMSVDRVKKENVIELEWGRRKKKNIFCAFQIENVTNNDERIIWNGNNYVLNRLTGVIKQLKINKLYSEYDILRKVKSERLHKIISEDIQIKRNDIEKEGGILREVIVGKLHKITGEDIQLRRNEIYKEGSVLRRVIVGKLHKITGEDIQLRRNEIDKEGGILRKVIVERLHKITAEDIQIKRNDIYKEDGILRKVIGGRLHKITGEDIQLRRNEIDKADGVLKKVIGGRLHKVTGEDIQLRWNEIEKEGSVLRKVIAGRLYRITGEDIQLRRNEIYKKGSVLRKIIVGRLHWITGEYIQLRRDEIEKEGGILRKVIVGRLHKITGEDIQITGNDIDKERGVLRKIIVERLHKIISKDIQLRRNEIYEEGDILRNAMGEGIYKITKTTGEDMWLKRNNLHKASREDIQIKGDRLHKISHVISQKVSDFVFWIERKDILRSQLSVDRREKETVAELESSGGRKNIFLAFYTEEIGTCSRRINCFWDKLSVGRRVKKFVAELENNREGRKNIHRNFLVKNVDINGKETYENHFVSEQMIDSEWVYCKKNNTGNEMISRMKKEIYEMVERVQEDWREGEERIGNARDEVTEKLKEQVTQQEEHIRKLEKLCKELTDKMLQQKASSIQPGKYAALLDNSMKLEGMRYGLPY